LAFASVLSAVAVATPTLPTIVELAIAEPSLSTLVKAVVAASLDGALGSAGPFTVFAPNNEAFKAFGDDEVAKLLKPENKQFLVFLLDYHVVPGQVAAADLDATQDVATLDARGKKLRVTKVGDKIQVIPPYIDPKNSRTVISADNFASNGVVHIIDGVIPIPIINQMQSARPTLPTIVELAKLVPSLSTVEERNQPLDLNLTQANRNSCLAAVKKYRPDMKLCNNKYSDMADQQAQYDNIHGPHAYLQTKGWVGTCRSTSVGQCECPKSGGYHGEDEALCFKTYFREGPENGDGKVHGHYTTMMSSSSKCVACGYSGDTTTHNFCGSDSMVSDEVVV